MSCGRIIEIMRYPVKSMAGELCAAAEVDWQGIEGDRQYGFVRRGNATRFPWLTGRDFSDLVRYDAVYERPEVPRVSSVTVRTPGGRSLGLQSAELVEELLKGAGLMVDLMQLGIGAYDLMPVSVVTTASLARLEHLHGDRLDRRRFRANIVIESDALETEWRGKHLRLGDDEDGVELLLTYPAPRCAMVTIDPDNGRRDPRVLRTVASEFAGAFTMYASVSRPGVLRAGDPVRVSPR